MNRDKIGTQTCYIHQQRLGHRHAIYINIGLLMYIACLCPNLASVNFGAIPILHSKFHKFFDIPTPRSPTHWVGLARACSGLPKCMCIVAVC